MNTVYIVVASGGDYESKWERNEAAFVDEPLAQAFIDEQIKKNEELKQKMLQLVEWAKEYEALNPQADRSNMQHRQRTRFAAGLGKHQITDEMRAQRKAEERAAQSAMEQYFADHKAWHEKAVEALNVQRALLGLEPEFAYRPYPYQDDVDYGIDTVELFGGSIVVQQTNQQEGT